MGYRRICCLGVQPSDTDNRITVEWDDKVFSVNQKTLDRYADVAALLAALEKFLGYLPEDIFFHKNRDNTWAIATGQAPETWAEDLPAMPELDL